jgi:hypothetical protein
MHGRLPVAGSSAALPGDGEGKALLINRVPDGGVVSVKANGACGRNMAATTHGRHYTRHGYAETRRHEQDGFRRVFFRKPVS